MSHRAQFATILIGVVLGACNVGQGSEVAASSNSALDIPQDVSTPLTWEGSAIDLYVADAWSACSAVADESTTSPTDDCSILPPTTHDRYMERILQLMETSRSACETATIVNSQAVYYNLNNFTCSATPLDPGNTLRHWDWVRKTNECNNVTTSTGTAQRAAPLTLERMPGVISSLQSPPSVAALEADDIVRTPGINLCIAQRLRHLAPGTAGASTLTLSAADQRELLSITRDRAQMALLGYARLARLLATPQLKVMATTSLEVAQDWFNNLNGGSSFLDELGDDFAAAVQVHTIATSDLFGLLARSASARIPWGAPSGTDSIALQFAEGSWRERSLALLYGGDPLAPTIGGTTPWAHFPFTSLSISAGLVVDHSAVDVREPQVDQLLQILRRYDGIDLREAPNAEGKHEVNVSLSANRIYRAGEAGVRTATCSNKINNVCQLVAPEDVEDPTLGIDGFLLWKNSRITLDHATTLTRLLADQIGFITDKKRGNATFLQESSGSADVLGIKSVTTKMGKDAGDYYHLDKDALMLERAEPETFEGEYFSKQIYIPTTIFTDADAYSQFFVWAGNSPNPPEGDRVTGAVKALAIVRHQLSLVDDDLANSVPSANTARLLAHETEIKNLIGAAIGSNFLLTEYQPQNYQKVSDGNGGFTTNVVNPTQMRITEYVAPDDAFWNSGVTPSALSLGFDDSGDFAVTPLESTTSKGFLNVDLTTVLTGVSPLGNSILQSKSPFSLRAQYTNQDAPMSRWEASIVSTGGTVGVEKTGSGSTGPSTYRLLLAHSVGAFPQAAANGGTLNRAGKRTVALQPSNPAQPMYDGFGYPVQLVPPSDSTLLGGAPGQSALNIYLSNAKQAADSAVAAITISFQTLLEEQKDQLAIEAQVAKSTQVISATQQSQCGQVNAKKCQADSALVLTPLLTQGLRTNEAVAHSTCVNGNDDHATLACAVYKMFHNYDVSMSLPNIVAGQLNKVVQPTFSDYAGGSLQAIFISAWADFRHLRDLLAQVYTGYGAADAKINAADATLAALKGEIANDCNPGQLILALMEGVSVSAGFPGGASVSVSMQPYFELMKKCQDLSTGIAPDQAQVVLAAALAINDMAEETMRVGDGAARVALDGAAGNEKAEQAQLAVETAQLDIQLARITAPTTTALYRRYHSYDAWRAQALLESARRYAVLARRAIEARYVIDLSTLQEPEPLVGAPASWADQVYEYDLNMPSAVGLTIGPQQTTGSIYPNAIVDYVQNLQRFVDGYILARPTTSAQADSEVLSLPGPSGLQGAGALPPGVIDSSSYRWDFYCPSQAAWVLRSSPNIDGVCGMESPTRARMTFSLDPWGRVGGTVGVPAYVSRYNSRWNRLVINVVGTGILDCSKAGDPLTCYTQSFLRYNLSQVGPSWVTDFSEVFHALNVQRGQIEGGKALAAEEWLDPLANGWSKPFVSAVARSEYADRPFGGTYELVFQLGPEVTLSHIERIQVLLESNYWVKQ